MPTVILYFVSSFFNQYSIYLLFIYVFKIPYSLFNLPCVQNSTYSILIFAKIKALIKISKEKHKCTPIQNGKLAFKSLKWIVLGVHKIFDFGASILVTK